MFARKLLSMPGVDLGEVDNNEATAIGNAAFCPHEKMLSYLLDVGGDINVAAADSTTALMDCISTSNHSSLSVLLEKARPCGLLLAKPDDKGESCLHYLARRADTTTVNIVSQALSNGRRRPRWLRYSGRWGGRFDGTRLIGPPGRLRGQSSHGSNTKVCGSGGRERE